MEKINIGEKLKFNDMFMPQVLKFTQSYKVPLICMKAGQEIPPHPSGTGVFYIIKGSAVMTFDSEEKEVCAGEMVFVEKGESRGIRATSELVAFAVHISE